MRLPYSFILTVLFFSNLLNAQISLTNSYFPVAGDSFKVAVATPATTQLVTLTPAGANQTWNFNFLRSALNNSVYSWEIYKNISSDTTAQRQYPDGELIRISDTIQVAVLNKTSSNLDLLGFKNATLGTLSIPNVVFRYSPPVNDRHAPLVYNNPVISFTSNFIATVPSSVFPDSIIKTLPIKPDSIRMNYRITRQDKTDAWGNVIMPGNSQAIPVLRERRQAISEVKIEAKISIFPWLDITSIVLGTLGGNVQQPKDTSISYYFWSNTTKQPLVVISTNAQDSIQLVRFRWQQLPTSISNTEGAYPSSILIFPNPAQASVASTAEIKNWKSTHYTATITQIDGKIISTWHGTTPSTERFSVPLPILPTGLYYLSISNGEIIQTVKFSVIP